MEPHATDLLDPARLATLAIDALERTAFVLADPADRPDALPAAEIGAEIRFHGSADGSVSLRASRAFGRNLAASLLGCGPEEIVDAQADEALRELANIVGGSVVSLLGGDDCRISLGLPATIAADGPDGLAGARTDCVLDAEGERLEIRCVRSVAA
jgi:hypothetical protein